MIGKEWGGKGEGGGAVQAVQVVNAENAVELSRKSGCQ